MEESLLQRDHGDSFQAVLATADRGCGVPGCCSFSPQPRVSQATLVLHPPMQRYEMATQEWSWVSALGEDYTSVPCLSYLLGFQL